ncbi:MAG: type II secretion system minor pseudopilin GspK [Burkholderiaceae bacterium]|nr:type II secretion system minor pseudopilin GspK [Burkholderiaceae bacterium]
MNTRTRPLREAGAALLAAMLTVTLVATLAAAALWQQWRSVEVETSERARVQAAWILVGALDWSRLILSEDGRSGGPDHLAEPWAVPLQEARLSTFLAAGDGDGVQDNTTDTRDAFLSGQIVDAQSRLNVMNLVDGDKVSATALVRFGRLFELLGLPRAQASVLANQMLRATSTSADDSAPLMPYRVDDLVWLGLPAPMVAVLAPYITVLPISTPVNLNTASAEVLYASGAADDLAAAQTLVAARQNTHFKNAKDALKLVSDGSDNPNINDFAIASRYFEVRGRLRLEQTIVEERSLVQRDGNTVKTLWRERGAIAGLDEALAPVTR